MRLPFRNRAIPRHAKKPDEVLQSRRTRALRQVFGCI